MAPLKNGEIGWVCTVLCSVYMPGHEIVRGNMQQLWFNAYSAPTAYGNGLRASQKDRGFETFENLHTERNSAMKYADVSGPIVVCDRESRLHGVEIPHGEGDQPVRFVDFANER